jgi:hypothetical protein
MTELATPAVNDDQELREKQKPEKPRFSLPLPGTDSKTSPEAMRDMVKRTMTSSNALLIIRATEFPEGANRDEERGLVAFSGFFTKPGALQQLILSKDFSVISQPRIMDFLTAACYTLVRDGALSAYNRQYLDAVKAVSPEGAQALERDLYRIVSGKKTKAQIPRVEGWFEDPFRIGMHELEKLRRDSFGTDAFTGLASFFNISPSTPTAKHLTKHLGKLPQDLSPAMQEIVMDHLNKFLLNDGNKNGSDATKIWYFYSGILRDVNIGARMFLFLTLHGNIDPKQARKIFGKLLLNWFEAPEGSSNSIHTLVSVYATSAGNYFPPLLRESGQIRERFIKLAATGRPYESSFAMKVLTDACLAPVDLRNIIRDIAQNDPSLGTKVFAARMLNFMSNFPDSSTVIPAMLDGLLESPKVTGVMPISDLSAGNTDNLAIALADAFPVFAAVNAPALKAALERRLAPCAPGNRIFDALKDISLPDEPDEDFLADEIRDATSIPLIETRIMDLEYLLGDRFVIMIKQNRNAISSLGSWTAVLKLAERDADGTFINEELQLNFDNCHLTAGTAVPNEVLPGVRKLGLLIGHKYFVRQKDNGATIPPPVASEPPQQEPDPEPVTIEEPTSEPPSGEPTPDEEPAPPSSDSGIVLCKERKERMLTVDIREQQRKRKEAAESRIKSTLDDNKKAVESLLKGDPEGIEIAHVLLHRRIEGMESGTFDYERVPPEEIRKAVEAGNLIDQDWYILNSLPHMKVVGYRVKSFRDKETGTKVLGVERCGRTDFAEMAYMYYQASDLPDLSSFHEMDVSFGIVADAVYVPDQLVELRTDGENPTSLHIGETVMTDNNASLALMMHDPVWMKLWAESQARVINQEMDEIMESGIPDDQKLQEIEQRERKLADLPKLLKGMAKESRVRLHKTDDPEEICASVKLAMGYVLTETTFNRGNYVSLMKFAKLRNIAGLPVDEKVNETDNDPESEIYDLTDENE